MKRALRWPLTLGAIVILGFGGVIGYAHYLAGETFEESVRITARMQAEVQARDGVRPTLLEPAAEGDARAIYEAVMPRMNELSEREDEILQELEWGSDETADRPSEQEITTLLERTRPLLELLRPALRMAAMRPHPSQGNWPQPEIEEIPPWQSFSRITSAHVEQHLRIDEVDEALDLSMLRWFVGLDFARHTSQIGYLVGSGIAGASASDVRRILADFDVSAERLERLARELEILRTSAPTAGDALRTEEIGLRRLIRDQEEAKSELLGEDQLAAGWRFLFSQRLLMAHTLRHLTPTGASFRHACAGKSGRDGVAATEALVDELKEGPNVLLTTIFSVYPYVLRRQADYAMGVELLRVTVALARHREQHGHLPASLAALVPTYLSKIPTCPYSGEDLRYDGDKVWSIGGDGIDSRGEPQSQTDDVTEDGDVVYTLRTRELRRFPWPDEVIAATRSRVNEAIRLLYGGGSASHEARATLTGFGMEIRGRLISEFKAIHETQGFDTLEGRSRAAAIEVILRDSDGFMERRWREHERIRPTSDPAFVRKLALRWTNWWYRGQAFTDPQDPWGPDDEE